MTILRTGFLALYFLLLVFQSKSFAQEFTWENVRFNGMGFVTGINIHPEDPDYIVVRTDVGGNYRWDAANNRWIPLLDAFNAPGVSGDAMSLADPNLLYSVTTGSLLYKSTNRGDSWTRMEGFPVIHVNSNTHFYRWGGKRLVVDPNNNGSVLYYASERDGLWRSLNYGEDWQQVSTSQVPRGEVGGNIFVAIDKNSGGPDKNSDIIYVGVQKAGVYRSSDAGQTWQLLPGGPDPSVYYPVSGAISSTGVLYVTYSTQASAWADGTEGRIYKTSNGQLVNITPTNNNRLGFNGIDVAADNPEKIIALQWKPGNTNGIHLSVDGGNSWKPIAFSNRTEPKWYPTYSPWTFTGQIMFDRQNPDKVWKVNGFGVYVTENVQANNPLWKAEMNNLEEFVAGQIHIPPVPEGKSVFSLVMDKIAFAHDNPGQVPVSGIFGSPEEFGIGTGMDWSVTNPSVAVIVGSQQRNIDRPRHRYTTNNGSSWQSFPSIPANFANGSIAISATDENLWVWAPHNQDTSVPNVQMHYTKDKGISWQASSGIPAIRNSATHTWAQSTVLVSDRVNGDYFYYYLPDDNGAIYRSADGGVTFSKVYSGLPQFFRARLKSVPFKEGHLFFHTENGSLMHSTDHGSSWQQVSGISQVRGIGFGKAIAPSGEPAIYLAATINNIQAVYLSTDYGKTWKDISKGNMPVGQVRDLSGDLRTAGLVYAATGGRGVMYGSADFSTGFFNQPEMPDLKELKVFPNPVNNQTLHIEFSDPLSDSRIMMYNLIGALVLSKVSTNVHTEQINLQTLIPGVYVLRIEKNGIQQFKQTRIIVANN